MSMDILAALEYYYSIRPGNLPIFLVLSTAILALWAWPSTSMATRVKHWEAGAAALTILVFGVVDWLLLAALPQLELSFAPIIDIPLTGITALRILIFILLLVVLSLGKIRWRDRGPAQKKSAVPIGAGLILLWFLNLGVLVCEVDGLYIEPFDLRVTELHLPGPVFFPDRPLRIVHLSDLHVERTTKRERELVDIVYALEPDLIILTGDYLNLDYLNDPVARRDGKAVLSQLSAPYGVYAVSGSVDSADILRDIFNDLDIFLLQDDVERLKFQGGGLYLVGLSLMKRSRDDGVALRQLMSQLPQGAYSLLLYHTPDLVEIAAETEVDLYLAGHTHGGQIRLPLYGALITGSAYNKQYESGLYAFDGTTLYVSRGIGMEGLKLPRARFFCPPEIVLINLGSEVSP